MHRPQEQKIVKRSRPVAGKPRVSPSSRDRGLSGLTVFCACATAALTFLAFWPALDHQFVDWDDTDNFINNVHFRGLGWDNIEWMFTTFHMGHYQPLTWLSLGVNAVVGESLFGDALDPRPYHFTNNLLHALNAALVFFIALRLLEHAWRLERRTMPAVGGALAAALFFGVHPLRVESVAWATERRDLLSGLFLFLAVLAYLRAVDHARARRARGLAIALLLFSASLMSKVIGVTLPAVLLIMDWYPLRRLGDSPRDWFSAARRSVWLEKLPFFALTVTFSLIATLGQGRHDWLVTLDMHPIPARIMQSMYGLAFYLWKTVAPFDLLPLYQMYFPLDTSQPRFLVAAGAVLASAALLAWLFITRRWPALVATAAVYVVILSPVLGMIQNGMQIVADRYSYLPCIGWAVLGGGMLGLAMMRWGPKASPWIGGAAAAVILALGALTWNQTLVWRDTASLWTYMVNHDPESSHAQNGYGFVLLERKQWDEAIAHLERSIELLPTNDMAHINLWDALDRKGDQAALITALERGKQLGGVAAEAHFRHGNILLGRGDLSAAEQEFRKALIVRPRWSRASVNLGYALKLQGRHAEALDQYQVAAESEPTLFQARYNLGVELRRAGRPRDALPHLRAAVQLRPDHAEARNELRQAEQAMSVPGN